MPSSPPAPISTQANVEQFREAALRANLELYAQNLAVFTFGNASVIDRKSGLVFIKPSGVDYKLLSVRDIVTVTLDGQSAHGSLRPSSDIATHLELYRAFPLAGSVVHTHSLYATTWAQAGSEIPVFGTTHADYFRGAIPITDELTEEEVSTAYEVNTGRAIARAFKSRDPQQIPAVLVRGHAPFCWGSDGAEAVHNAAMLERVAHMAWQTHLIDAHSPPLASYLVDRHYFRKHGGGATYGQLRQD